MICSPLPLERALASNLERKVGLDGPTGWIPSDLGRAGASGKAWGLSACRALKWLLASGRGQKVEDQLDHGLDQTCTPFLSFQFFPREPIRQSGTPAVRPEAQLVHGRLKAGQDGVGGGGSVHQSVAPSPSLSSSGLTPTLLLSPAPLSPLATSSACSCFCVLVTLIKACVFEEAGLGEESSEREPT